MKTEDFERLKEICEKEGFEVKVTFTEEPQVFVTKKDPWEGVEFVEAVKSSIENDIESGKIYKVDSISGDLINISNNVMKTWWIKFFKPSTESSYVEQLKKEAFERFGEIKSGDMFKLPSGRTTNAEDDSEIFYFKEFYFKENDEFYINGIRVYKQGKWAERVKERIEVKAEGGNIDSGHFYFIMNKTAKEKCRKIGCWDINEFLAKQLENYLNDDKQA